MTRSPPCSTRVLALRHTSPFRCAQRGERDVDNDLCGARERHADEPIERLNRRASTHLVPATVRASVALGHGGLVSGVDPPSDLVDHHDVERSLFLDRAESLPAFDELHCLIRPSVESDHVGPAGRGAFTLQCELSRGSEAEASRSSHTQPRGGAWNGFASWNPTDLAITYPKVRAATGAAPHRGMKSGQVAARGQGPSRPRGRREQELDHCAASARASHHRGPYLALIDHAKELLRRNAGRRVVSNRIHNADVDAPAAEQPEKEVFDPPDYAHRLSSNAGRPSSGAPRPSAVCAGRWAGNSVSGAWVVSSITRSNSVRA